MEEQKIGSGFGKNNQYGIRTSKQLKRIGCAALKEMIETDKLIIPDFDTIAELTTFASKYNSYEAEEGHHDDLAMGLVVFSWLVQQQYFKDMTDLIFDNKCIKTKWMQVWKKICYHLELLTMVEVMIHLQIVKVKASRRRIKETTFKPHY